MANLFLLQMIGLVLAAAGLIALTASAHLFGTPLSPAEKHRASNDWNRSQNTYRLPLNLDTIASSLCFLAGIGILAWSKFELCSFLAYWLPSLPAIARSVLSCR
jgi:hypothetical protein